GDRRGEVNPTGFSRVYFRRMKAIFPSAVIAAALLMSACGDGKSDAAKEIAAVTDSVKTASTVDLDQYHMPLLLEAPPEGPTPSILWKDVSGKLEIRAGDKFGLTIMEDPGDMQRLKGDLDRDLLKKNTILQETPDELVYKSEFPDDSTLVFVHFQRVVKAAGRTFVIQDMDNGTAFTKADVDRMAASITPKQPA
ncbi:MAG: hypothetical protein ABI373_05140, partial [Flavobacteriales bacterium]